MTCDRLFAVCTIVDSCVATSFGIIYYIVNNRYSVFNYC